MTKNDLMIFCTLLFSAFNIRTDETPLQTVILKKEKVEEFLNLFDNFSPMFNILTPLRLGELRYVYKEPTAV